MTEQEFKGFIEEQKQSGKSEEEIVKVFCLMFKEDELDREQLEAVLSALGYEMSEELKGMSDEELKEEIVTNEGEKEDVKKEDEIDPDGDVPPNADPEDKPEEGEEKVEEKVEEKTETEDEERERAMKLFGLGEKK